MKINSISASRKKTFEMCQYKYLLTYSLYFCDDCGTSLYDNEFTKDKECTACHSKNISKPEMKTNWGAVHGTALHWVLESYANGRRGFTEDGVKLSESDIHWMTDWKKNIDGIYLRGAPFQDKKEFALLDIAKPKEYHEVEKECQSCPLFNKGSNTCGITKDNVDDMPGCPINLYNKSHELLDEFMTRQQHIYEPNLIKGVEAEFTIDLGQKDMVNNPMIVKGFMDYVYVLDDKTIEMVDYKAGAKTQDYNEVYNDIQAKIYSIALKSLYPGFDDYLLTFDYFRGKPITVSYSEKEDNETKDILIETWKRIVAPQNVQRSIGWWCNALCDKKLCDKEWPKFLNKFKDKK